MVMFYSPGCGYCQQLHPHWERLSTDYAGSALSGVFEVNCQGSGQLLCKEARIRGYPMVRYGDASRGPRGLTDFPAEDTMHTYETLLDLALQELGRPCSLQNIDEQNEVDPKVRNKSQEDVVEGCSPEEKAQLRRFSEMPLPELQSLVASLQATFKGKEKDLQSERRKFDDAQDAFERDLKEFKTDKALFTKATKTLDSKPPNKVSAREKQKHAAKKARLEEKSTSLESRRLEQLAARSRLTEERQRLEEEKNQAGLRIAKLTLERRSAQASTATAVSGEL